MIKLKKHFIVYVCIFTLGILIGSQAGKVLPTLRVKTKKVVFYGPNNFSLVGKIYYPRSFPWEKHPSILFCHGTLPRGKDTKLYKILSKQLAKKGYLVFTFDLRGFGDSYKVANFQVPKDIDFIGDVEYALNYMIEKLPVDKQNVTIAGHSLGANLSFAVGARSPKIKNIISIAPGNYKFPERYSPSRRKDYIRKLEKAMGQNISERYWAHLIRPLNLFQYLPIEQPKNIYLILADGDRPDVIRYSEKLFDKLNTKKGLLIIPHSNHNFGTEYFEGNEVIDQRPSQLLAKEIDMLLSQR